MNPEDAQKVITEAKSWLSEVIVARYAWMFGKSEEWAQKEEDFWKQSLDEKFPDIKD